MGLYSRQKNWDDGDILTEADLEGEFDHIYDSVVAGTTIAVGCVQLEDSHASTSITKAACPKNVKEAYDLAAGAVAESDYNANTFLYAVSDNTPVVKTRAETLALLSGQANASFDMNSQAITKLSNIVTAHTPGAAGTATLDLNVSRIHDITMPAGNITIAISNENNGDIFTIRISQDGTGSRTVTWFSTIKWEEGTTPTLTTTANKADTIIFRVTGTDTYDGFIVGQNI